MQNLNNLTKPGGFSVKEGQYSSWPFYLNNRTIITEPECKIGVLGGENLNKYTQ